MGGMASQITGVSSVYSTVCSGADQKKTSRLRVSGLCEGNSPGTGEFHTQRASNVEMIRFDDVIMANVHYPANSSINGCQLQSLQIRILDCEVRDKH